MRTSLILAGLLVFGFVFVFASASQASAAELRVKSCSYDLHSAHIAEIRTDNYFENEMEMNRLDARHFQGRVELSDGYTLHVNAELSGGKVHLLSEVRSGDAVSIRVSGSANLPKSGTQAYALNRANTKPTIVDSSDDAVTVFDKVGIRCVVGPTTIGDRLNDWVSAPKKSAISSPSPRRASHRAGVS